MAPTQKAEAAGKGRKTQVLGKRPGGQLGKSIPESLPKRSKLTTDSHPVAGTKKKQGKSKPSLSHVDDDDDKENIGPDDSDVDETFVPDDGHEDSDGSASDDDFESAEDVIIDEDLEIPAADCCDLQYDEDTEEVVEDEEVEGDTTNHSADGSKAAICERQMQLWIEDDEANDQLLSLSAEERLARIKNCEYRFSSILSVLVMTAHSIPKSDFDDWSVQKDLPFTFKWWVFFVTIAVDKILAILMASISNRVRVILGGPLSFEKLLLLPGRWVNCTWWEVYTDILRDNLDGSEHRYVGSACNKHGAWPRLGGHDKMMKGGKLEPGDHCKMVGRHDVDKNFRLFAYFNKYVITKPYPLLMEFCVSILLQSFSLTPGTWLDLSVLDLIKRATPDDVPRASHGGLNRAAQCLQGLWHRRRPVDLICKHCKRKDSTRWFSFKPGVPFSHLICLPCYSFRWYNHLDRPLYMEERRLRHAFLGDPPAKGERCPGCTKPVPQWVLPSGGPWKEEPGRLRWECITCSRRSTDKLVKRDQSFWDRLAATKLLTKPAANAICPGCNIFFASTRYWLPPLGDSLKEPLRQRYECKNCASRPTDKLGSGRHLGTRAAILKTLTKPKGPATCPGCKRYFLSTKEWYAPLGDILNEPLRQRHECRACGKTPTNLLSLPRREIPSLRKPGGLSAPTTKPTKK